MRALIIKTSSLGDVLHTFGVVEYLKKRGVESIGWAVEKKAAPLVHAHPMVDTVIELDSAHLRALFPHPSCIREFFNQRKRVRKERWDVAFDFQANCKSGLVTFLARAGTKVGYAKKRVSEWPNVLATNTRFVPPSGLSVRGEYLWMVKEYFQDHFPFSPSPVQLLTAPEQEEDISLELSRWPEQCPVWIVAPGSYWKSKTCRLEMLLELFSRVQKRFSPYYIFVAGTNEELSLTGKLAEKFPQTSHVLFRPDLVVLQHVMDRACAVVSMDSLVLHLGATTKTPTFGIFGPSSAARYGPEGLQHGAYQGRCYFGEKFERRCRYLRTCPGSPCLHKASPHEILEPLSTWYERITVEKQDSI